MASSNDDLGIKLMLRIWFDEKVYIDEFVDESSSWDGLCR